MRRRPGDAQSGMAPSIWSAAADGKRRPHRRVTAHATHRHTDRAGLEPEHLAVPSGEGAHEGPAPGEQARLPREAAGEERHDGVLDAVVGADDLDRAVEDDVEAARVALLEEPLALAHAAPRAVAGDALDLARREPGEHLIAALLEGIGGARHGREGDTVRAALPARATRRQRLGIRIERSLVAKLKDKPFALIGVNVNDYETKDLKERMAREKMNWRSFAHQEAINSKWNPSTPGYYVLDPTGVIRHKWLGAPGERAIDATLEKLIKEAEAEASHRQQQQTGTELDSLLPAILDWAFKGKL